MSVTASPTRCAPSAAPGPADFSAPAPDAGAATPFYRQLSRHAAAFALAVDLSLLTLGGALKRKEMLSARFGDILSELYLSSAALKRWNDEGRQKDDFPLLEWCMEASFATIETRFDEIIANFPIRPVAWLLRFFIQPFGPRRRGPSDRVTDACAAIITNPCPARDRLIVDLFHPPETAARQWACPARARLRRDGRRAADPRPHAHGACSRYRSGGKAAHDHRGRGRATQRRGRRRGGGHRGR